MSPLLTHDERLERLRQAQERFAALLEQAPGEASVPACPGWAVSDLARHLGIIHRWAAAIVLGGAMLSRPEPRIARPLPEWYRGTADALRAALAAVDPGEETLNVLREPDDASFWSRRQLHETLIHLVDLEQALGLAADPVPAHVAADGVDEVLTVFFRRLEMRETPPDLRAPVRLRATDTGDTWVVVPEEIGCLGPADLRCEGEIAGSASDLYLVLWGRLPGDAVTVTGPAARTLLVGPTSL